MRRPLAVLALLLVPAVLFAAGDLGLPDPWTAVSAEPLLRLMYVDARHLGRDEQGRERHAGIAQARVITRDPARPLLALFQTWSGDMGRRPTASPRPVNGLPEGVEQPDARARF